jgi:hypothetical protein
MQRQKTFDETKFFITGICISHLLLAPEEKK